jgi:single-stranded DNA-binding protein
LRTWDGQDGQRRARNEIVADRVKFLDRQAAIVSAENKTDESETGDIEPGDIPF